MRLTDLLILPIAALWQQKLRTILTTLGVVFGAFVLSASLSIGEGVQETIDRESRKNDFSRKITVFPSWKTIESKADADVEVLGTMSPERRERLRKALADQKRSSKADARVLVRLSEARLGELARLPHVERVLPIVNDSGLVLLGTRPEGAGIYAGAFDGEAFHKRIIAGRGYDAPNERGVLVSELLAYRIGLVDESDLQQIIGKPLRLEVQGQRAGRGFNVSIREAPAGQDQEFRSAIGQLAAQLPGAFDKFALTVEEIESLRKALQAEGPAVEPGAISEDFPVLGVFREATTKEQENSWSPASADQGLVLPPETAARFCFREPGRRDEGLDQVVLVVDTEKNVKDVVKLVEGLGLRGHAAIEFIERERLMYILIFGGMTCVAGVALLVSSLGIANTMLMSVLERTREIGIMKSVGADNRHLQFIFLVEGGLIGLSGAMIGLALAYSASFPGDSWVRSMVQRDMKIDLHGSIFAFPPWIALTVVAFTVLVTTIAALYPARHASRIDPVKALRHE